MLASYDVEPGSDDAATASTMTEFNLWTWNNRVFPGIDPLVARTGDRVRIRIGNLTMTNHPIHMHGPHFEVTGTDGGWVPKAARWPEVTTDVGVGQLRAIEFDAVAGDWAIHCHKSHHTMNAMGHDIPNDGWRRPPRAGRAHHEARSRLHGDGRHGHARHGRMEMPLPDNTLPMMTGQGPFGPVGMGGMFSVVKVRDDREAWRLQGPGLVQAPARHGGL